MDAYFDLSWNIASRSVESSEDPPISVSLVLSAHRFLLVFFFHPTKDEQRVIGRLFTCRTPKKIEFFDCHPIDCLFYANKKLKERELGLRLVSTG